MTSTASSPKVIAVSSRPPISSSHTIELPAGGDDVHSWQREHQRAARIEERRLASDHRVAELPDTNQQRVRRIGDRKSTRLNSSHLGISYAVFCLKKKKKKKTTIRQNKKKINSTQP